MFSRCVYVICKVKYGGGGGGEGGEGRGGGGGERERERERGLGGLRVCWGWLDGMGWGIWGGERGY